MLLPLAQLAQATPWWMTEFRSYSTQHAIVVVTALVSVAGAVLLARRWKRTAPRQERTMRWLWALGIIPLQIWSIVFWMLPAQFNLLQSLPLHICDLIVWIVPIALLTDFRWAKTLVYFVGIGLSIFAFVTPVLQEGASSWEFWLFWLGHTQIVGSAIYLCAVMGYIPTRRDLMRTMLVCLGYAAVIVPFDILLNVNYGYIGPMDFPDIVTQFGPWPWRMLPMIAVMFSLFALLWLPWAWRTSGSTTKQRAEPLGIDVPARDDDPDA